MKQFLLVIFFSFSGFIFGQKIYWSESRKLTWDDFKSQKNISSKDHTLAYAYCGIQYSVKRSTDPKKPVTITIKSVFDIEKSWKRSDSLNDYILKHEQNHFDISEIFARQLRKFAKENIRNSGDYEKYFKKKYQDLYAEYMSFQETYDRETKNSLIVEKQEYYNQLIADKLQELNAYR